MKRTRKTYLITLCTNVALTLLAVGMLLYVFLSGSDNKFTKMFYILFGILAVVYGIVSVLTYLAMRKAPKDNEVK